MTPAGVETMISPELIVSFFGFALTFGTMLYKFGRLEGQMSERLRQNEQRLERLERMMIG